RINFSCILEGTSRFAIQGLRRRTWRNATIRTCFANAPSN
ncbi:AraC family transcriptional regulator, partial [Klebsiella pneumoniae]|nr:AraC family transcriptional regulator [Klebsiella pneumoniae]